RWLLPFGLPWHRLVVDYAIVRRNERPDAIPTPSPNQRRESSSGRGSLAEGEKHWHLREEVLCRRPRKDEDDPGDHHPPKGLLVQPFQQSPSHVGPLVVAVAFSVLHWYTTSSCGCRVKTC